MENSKSILETKSEVESKIKELEDSFQEFEKDKLELTIEIDSLKGYEKEWKNFQEAQDKEDKIDREIGGLINKLSTIETEELRNSQQFTQQEKLIEEYYKNEKQINKNKEIRDEIGGVREKLGIVKDELKQVNKDVLTLNGKVSALQKPKRNNRR